MTWDFGQWTTELESTGLGERKPDGFARRGAAHGAAQRDLRHGRANWPAARPLIRLWRLAGPGRA
jgi:hypothetical protein